MPKSSEKRSFDFGRVFFPGKKDEYAPSEIRFQPLDNHVGNVSQLVQYWDEERLPDKESSKIRILEASRIHDMGKPSKFEIRSETTKQGKSQKFQKYIYSFRGHRFLAVSDNKWAEKMAIGHHDFSAQEICKDTYQLKQENSDYQKILERKPLAYAQELYVLEMCDQIEAELACRTMDDDEQGSSRTFMDFTIQQDAGNPLFYQIDPWPFNPEQEKIELTFKYWTLKLSSSQKKLLNERAEKAQDTLGKKLDSIVKDWWQASALTEADTATVTITLAPYLSQLDESCQPYDANQFYQQIATYQPNPMQAEMFSLLYDTDPQDPPAIVLKGPTGSGKTEAVLFPALASRCRLFLPLPARSLLEDQKARIEKYIKTFSKLHPKQEFSLVVDTGSHMERYIYQDGEEQDVRGKLNSRRHLYKGDVILTTIDKMLYRFFAYGDKQKSFTFPLRLNRDRSLICFDEAHTYDNLSFTNFHNLVTALYEAGQALVVMTATLPKQHQLYFNDFQVIDYVGDPERADKLRHFQNETLKRPHLDKRDFVWHRDNSEDPKPFPTAVSQIALETISERISPRILLVVQRVSDAVEIYQHIKTALAEQNQDSIVYLYHGRIADQVRPKIYQKINDRDSSLEPYILVTTSAIEVGCDLNADILITEICPPENLVQRVGRCNRKGNISDAKVIVVGSTIPSFVNNLDEEGWQHYRDKLIAMSGSQFETSEVTSCIARTPHVDDYRVVEIFSMLYDYIYGADLTCQPTHERGLVPTRSWTPSVELQYTMPNGKPHSISVPVDRLATKSGERYAHTSLFERRYDVETTQWKEEPVKAWGDIYRKQLIVKISPDLGLFCFDDASPYVYNEELGFVDLPKIFESTWIQGAEVKLKYVCINTSEKSNVVIYSYVNSST
jgi:CRISPR-associated endonuclease/helicase Cas3